MILTKHPGIVWKTPPTGSGLAGVLWQQMPFHISGPIRSSSPATSLQGFTLVQTRPSSPEWISTVIMLLPCLLYFSRLMVLLLPSSQTLSFSLILCFTFSVFQQALQVLLERIPWPCRLVLWQIHSFWPGWASVLVGNVFLCFCFLTRRGEITSRTPLRSMNFRVHIAASKQASG